MKDFGSTILPWILLIWIFIVLGCTGGSFVETERRACITPDGSRIGVAKDFTVTLIDAESGRVLRTERGENSAGAICLANNKVIAVYPKVIIELNGDKRGERNEEAFTIVGAADNDGIVHYTGGKLQSPKSSFTDPLKVYYEKFGVITKNPKTIVLLPETFPGLLTKQFAYWMIPVRVLSDGNLLVVAGSRPSINGATDSDKPNVGAEPWGFFLVNPQTGEIRNFGGPKIQNADFNFINVPKAYATPDGHFIAITSSWGRSDYLAIWSEAGNKQIFTKRFENADLFRDVIVSEDGRKVAVLIDLPGEDKLEVYDVEGGSLINSLSSSPIHLNSAEFLALDDEELILSDPSGTVAKMRVDTGSVIWVSNVLGI